MRVSKIDELSDESINKLKNRLGKLEEFSRAVEEERRYQLENWHGSDEQGKYIKHLSDTMHDAQIKALKLKAEIERRLRWRDENN